MDVTSTRARLFCALLLSTVFGCSTASTSADVTADTAPEISPVVDAGSPDVAAETVDQLPPALAITSPERGALLETGDGFQLSATVWDENPIADAVRLVDLLADLDTAVPPADVVQLNLDLPSGIRIVQVSARDEAGNISREHRALRVGPFADCAPLAGVPDMAWDVGNSALAAAGQFAAQMVDDYDFTETLAAANPVYSDNGATVTIDAVQWSGLAILPKVENHQLTARVSLYDVSAAGEITIDGFPAPYTFVGEISGLELGVWLTASVQQQHVFFHLDEVTLEADDITFTAWNAAGEEVIAPTEVSGAFLEFITETITDALLEWANSAQDAVQEWVSGTFDFAFMGQPFAVQYEIIGVHVLQSRLRLGFQADVDLGVEPDHCIRRTYAQPPSEYEDEFDVSAWFAVDFLNRVLIQLWSLGVLEWTVDQAFVDDLKLEIDLVSGLMGDHLREAAGGLPPETPMTLLATLRQPPEFRSLGDGIVGEVGGTGLVVGGVRLRPYAGAVVGTDPFADITLSLAASLRAEIHSNKLHLAPQLPAFALDVDGIPEHTEEGVDMKRLVEREVEGHFEVLLPDALNGIAGALLAIPLPEAGGIVLQQGELVTESAPGFVRISGTVGGSQP